MDRATASAETSMEEALHYARSIIDSIREALIVLDDSLHVISANRSFYRQFQVLPEETEGRLIHELGNGQWNIPALRHMLEAIIPERTMFEGFEVRHRFEQIGEKVMLLNARLVQREGGRPPLILLAIEDITVQSKLLRENQALAESEQRYRVMGESVDYGVWATDARGKAIYISPSFCEMVGKTFEEIREFGWLDTLVPEQRQEVAELWLHSVRTGEPFEHEHHFVGKNGEIRIVLARGMPVRDKFGRVASWAGINLDITERKSMETLIADLARFPEENPNPVVRLAREGVVLYANDAGKTLLDQWQCSVGSAVPDPWLRVITDAFSDGSPRTLEIEAGDRVLSLNIVPVPERGYLNVYGRDITGQRRAREALQESEKLFRAAVDNYTSVFVIYSRDRRIQFVNKTGLRMLGLAEEQVLGHTDEDILPPEIHQHYLPHLLESIRTKENRHFEFTYVLREKRYTNIVDYVPLLDDRGEVYRILGITMDVTPLHELQERLAGERNFVDAVLQTSGALIVVADTDGRIVRFNRACEQLTGYRAEEVESRSAFELLVPEGERAGVEEAVSRLRAGERTVDHENHWLTKSGEKRFIRWRNSILRDDRGGVAFIIGTGIDISDRKYLEEELSRRARDLTAANRDLESFSYSASHDLRGPLHAIGGFADLLREDYAGRLDEHGQDYVRRIRNGVKKMERLIDDMLNLSRIGRHEMHRERVDLSAMMRDYLEELKSGQPDRRVEFIVQENVHADADPRLMGVALENLLRNAWKFTSKEEITRIEFGTAPRDGTTLFFVRDNGVGFDMRFAEKIFEPFRRGHPEKEFGGTGVGLSIVQRVISRHGGAVWAESEPGKGATFYFTLGMEVAAQKH